MTLRDAFFPLKCQACGFFLESRYSGADKDSDVLCSKCVLELKRPSSPMCNICGKSLNSGIRDRKCGDCISRRPDYDAVRSVFYYEGPTRKIVHAMKYRGITRLAEFMGSEIYMEIEKFFVSCEALIVPVPLHPKKIRKRGYNQAALISESIRAAWKDSGKKTVFYDPSVLFRRLDTRSQAGLHKYERVENVKNAFALKSEEIVSGRDIILVDDVFTTGATVSSCAKILKKAGASGVYVFTFARVRD